MPATEDIRPTLDFEKNLWQQGYRYVAGVDEVGRGAWAGPVFAAAVIFPCYAEDLEDCLCEVRDSKLLSPSRRTDLLGPIYGRALTIALGQASCQEIDEMGIVRATFKAMRAAIAALSITPDHILVDAFRIPDIAIPQQAIIKGDALSISIAAASIVAKVARDQVMTELDPQYPGYGFANHKGYGTPEHRRALRELGTCAIHRKTWRPALQLQSPDELYA